MIENILSSLGFTNTESQILLKLLSRGETSASVLAKISGIKRPTVYAALDTLIQKGLATKQKRNKTIFFRANSIKNISQIIKNDAQQNYLEVESNTRLLEKHLELLPHQDSLIMPNFQVETIESTREVYKQLEEALVKGEFLGIFNPQVLINNGTQPLLKEFLTKTAKNQPQIRELLTPGPQANWYRSQVSNPNHQIKLLPDSKKITSDIILYQDTIYIFDYQESQELTIKIHNQSLYTTLKTIFEILWSGC